MQKAECPYVNRHKFCPKCGKESPKECGLLETSILVAAPDVEQTETPKAPEETKATYIPETVTFVKLKGRGRK